MPPKRSKATAEESFVEGPLAPPRLAREKYGVYQSKLLDQAFHKRGGKREISLGKRGKEVGDILIRHTASRIAHAATISAILNKRHTITAKDVQAAAAGVIPDFDFAEEAIEDSNRHLASYEATEGGSQTQRAGLILSVPRVGSNLLFAAHGAHMFGGKPELRVSAKAKVVLASIVQSIVSKFLFAAAAIAEATKREKVKVPRINASHIFSALHQHPMLGEHFHRVLHRLREVHERSSPRKARTPRTPRKTPKKSSA